MNCFRQGNVNLFTNSEEGFIVPNDFNNSLTFHFVVLSKLTFGRIAVEFVTSIPVSIRMN